MNSSLSTNQKHKKPNLLFVFADQWRKQAIGCLHDDPVRTPNVDRFAEDSLLFTNALSLCPVCVPARAAILTGRYPTSNGVLDNGCRLPDAEWSIGDILKRSGYATGYIGKWHLDGRHHETQFVPPERRHGFDFWYAANMPHHLYVLEYYTGTDTHIFGHGWAPDHETDVAIDYIRRNKDNPFALVLSWTPPHPGREHSPEGLESTSEGVKGKILRDGYIAPQTYEEAYAEVRELDRPNYVRPKQGDEEKRAHQITGYFGAITSLDDNFARLLACLEEEGLVENTIVVLHSDHGEMLGSHGRSGKHIWYEESIGVPFIIRWPGRIMPRREGTLFNQVDIVPSMLGLMGIPIPDRVEGTDFSPLMSGSRMNVPDSALLYFANEQITSRHSNWRCLRTNRYSYVVSEKNGKVEKKGYDLAVDPYQMAPILTDDGEDELRRELETQLSGWLRKTNDPFVRWLEP